jgi:predicted  nucleic acid-binding Zn-ribbon protein
MGTLPWILAAVAGLLVIALFFLFRRIGQRDAALVQLQGEMETMKEERDQARRESKDIQRKKEKLEQEAQGYKEDIENYKKDIHKSKQDAKASAGKGSGRRAPPA